MITLDKLFHTLSYTGIDTLNETSQSVLTTNISILITWGISLPYMFAFYYLGLDYLFVVNSSMLLLYPTVLLLNKYRYHLLAKHWFITLGYLHVSLLCTYLSAESGAELYFYLLPILAVLIYSRNEKNYMFLAIFLFIPFYAFTQYLYTVFEPGLIDPYLLKAFYYSSIVVVLFTIISFFYFFKMISLHYQDRLEEEKRFNQTLIDTQEQLIITTDGTKLLSANETFFKFFEVTSIEAFTQHYHAACISDLFSTNVPKEYLQNNSTQTSWIDPIIANGDKHTYKVMIEHKGSPFIFSVTAAELLGEKALKLAVFTNITEIEHAKIEIEMIHQNVKESIEYASLIQEALIPKDALFKSCFSDHFSLWQPRDTVGGDIYLFELLRHEEECLLMVIDCAGHGVPGALVTMLVKAIERQITFQIKHDNEEVSPAKILSIFNKNMKQLLQQESLESISNAGFDGAVLYYDKPKKLIKYAGAKVPLFYIQDHTLHTLKADRHSVGYKKCRIDYPYTEQTLEVKDGMQLYLTTDGYLDQNGGKDDFPFGKIRFKELIERIYTLSMKEQKEQLIQNFNDYRKSQAINDDVTVIGLKI